jgi:hypothetical protein
LILLILRSKRITSPHSSVSIPAVQGSSQGPGALLAHLSATSIHMHFLTKKENTCITKEVLCRFSLVSVASDHFQSKRAVLFSGHKQIEHRPGLNWSPFFPGKRKRAFQLGRKLVLLCLSWCSSAFMRVSRCGGTLQIKKKNNQRERDSLLFLYQERRCTRTRVAGCSYWGLAVTGQMLYVPVASGVRFTSPSQSWLSISSMWD